MEERQSVWLFAKTAILMSISMGLATVRHQTLFSQFFFKLKIFSASNGSSQFLFFISLRFLFLVTTINFKWQLTKLNGKWYIKEKKLENWLGRFFFFYKSHLQIIRLPSLNSGYQDEKFRILLMPSISVYSLKGTLTRKPDYSRDSDSSFYFTHAFISKAVLPKIIESF